MMRFFQRGFLLLLLSFIFPGLLSAQQGQPHKCLTDAVSHRLRQEHPERLAELQALADQAVEKTEDFSKVYEIPVVVHVVHDGGPEQNVTLNQVRSQIETLNEDYGRYGGGFNQSPLSADTRIRFCLASKDPEGRPTDGVEYLYLPQFVEMNPLQGLDADTALKSSTAWDPSRFLNIWTVGEIEGGNLLGYAFFPDEVAVFGQEYDGVVVDYQWLGRGTGSAIGLGRVVTHEVGHYLGLEHPWGRDDGSCGSDDGCDDTPNVSGEYYASTPFCNAPQGCDGEPRQIENYMDYSDDGCMNLFTLCQIDKMRESIVRYRQELVSERNLAMIGCGASIDSLPSANEILVYPNPTENYVMVWVDGQEDEQVDILLFHRDGRRVFEKNGVISSRGVFPVDLRDEAPGLYFLMVRTPSQTLTKNILKLR